MTTVASTKNSSTDSSDRTLALGAARTAPAHQLKARVSRFGDTAKRLLNTLMRSLSSPHI